MVQVGLSLRKGDYINDSNGLAHFICLHRWPLDRGGGKLGSGRIFVWVEYRDDTIDFGLEALSTADSSRGGLGSHTDFNERCVMGVIRRSHLRKKRHCQGHACRGNK